MSGYGKDAGGNRAGFALAAIRIAVAVLLFVHGFWRLSHGGVVPFGEWLHGQGVPFGPAVAWFVTIFELTGAPVLALGIRRLVAPVCLVFAAIYACGLWLVHWPEGWFVVGAGRNGMEYSALLIVCLLANAWRWWPETFARRRR